MVYAVDLKHKINRYLLASMVTWRTFNTHGTFQLQKKVIY